MTACFAQHADRQIGDARVSSQRGMGEKSEVATLARARVEPAPTAATSLALAMQ